MSIVHRWMNKESRKDRNLKNDKMVLNDLINKYKIPFFLDDFVFLLGNEINEAARTLSYVAALRMVYCLQKIADSDIVDSQETFQIYFDTLYQYYLLSNQEFSIDFLTKNTYPHHLNDNPFFAIQEAKQVTLVNSFLKVEYEQLVPADEAGGQLRQLLLKQRECLHEDGPYIMGFIQRMFPTILMQLEEKKK